MIAMGAGTNHWFHSDQVYRDLPRAGPALRLRGGQRRRLGALRRPGEGPPAGRLADGRLRPRLDAAAAPPVGDAVLLPRHRPVALRAPPPRGPRLAAGPGPAQGQAHRRRQRARRAARLAAVLSRASTASTPRPGRRGRAGRARAGRARRRASCGAGRLHFACEDPDAPENLPRVMTVWRSNLLGSSGKGHEYFLKHLLGDDGRRGARRGVAARAAAAARSPGASRRRRASSTC